MITTIFLVRHGHYDSPMPVAPYRLPGFHLSAKGKQDAGLLSQHLAGEAISAIFTSPLERTAETAGIIASAHGIIPVVDPRLIEVRSPLQGKTPEEIHALGGWNWSIYDTPWYAENGGETPAMILARMKECIEEHRKTYRGGSICLVSHGDPIMLATAYYGGSPIDTGHLLAMEPYVPMAGGFRMVFEADKAPGVYPIVVS